MSLIKLQLVNQRLHWTVNIMAELKENEEKLMNQNIEDQPPPTSAYSKKRQVIFHQQKLPKIKYFF